MTIAIGLRTTEGIVFAADSQETVSGYIKMNVGKIKIIRVRPGNALVFVGAGQSDYIETAIHKAMGGVDGIETITEITKVVENNLLEFFDNHLARWAYYPEAERPTVELLIGISTESGPFGLFHYSGTSFHSVERKAIGAGILLANTLLDEYCIGPETILQACGIAIHILSKVKNRVDTCGGYTNMVTIGPKGDFGLPEANDIERLERKFEKEEWKSVDGLRRQIVSERMDILWASEAVKRKQLKNSSQ